MDETQFVVVTDEYNVKKGDVLKLTYNVKYFPSFIPIESDIRDNIAATGRFEIISSSLYGNEVIVFVRAITDNSPILIVLGLIAGALISLFLYLSLKDVKVKIYAAGVGGVEVESQGNTMSTIMIIALIGVGAFALYKYK